jgi:cysteine desulfurase
MTEQVPIIYLDYNATTPVDPAVREAIQPFLADQFGNPSSNHILGRQAADAVSVARGQLARLLHCPQEELVFTSGGTQSSNLAILGIVSAVGRKDPVHLVISAIEHPATVESTRTLCQWGHSLTVVGCDQAGLIDPEHLAEAIQPNTALVSIMHANNEVGTIQPIRSIAEICSAAEIPLHVDAAQSVGKIPVDVTELGADLLTVAGHKFYAPKGIGALYIKKGLKLESPLRGAQQERGLSPGTENVSQIVAIGVAAELACSRLETDAKRIGSLRNLLEQLLKSGSEGQVTFNADRTDRLPNTSSVNFPHVAAKELLEILPHICASTGAACHSNSTLISATLAAMGISENIARGTVRLSLGRHTTQQEVEYASEQLLAAWRKLLASR